MSFLYCGKVKFTFTIVPTPSDATVKINNIVQNSAIVTKGSEITYSVEKDGYISQSGSQLITDNVTLEIELDRKPVTFTINPTPSDATVTLNDQTTKSIIVDYGTTVNWSVSKSGYDTQSGSEVVTSDTTKNIVLIESIPTIILESGRKLWRHPNNEGCVLEFNEFGKTTKLFVPDAKYRSTSAYALIPTPNQNDFRYLDSIGAPHIQYNTISFCLTNLESNTDSALQTFLTQSIPNISTEWTAKQYTNTYLQYVPDSPACLFARSIVPTGLSGCDVPNLYELCVLWLEGANIDKYDPTVTENSSKKMEKFAFSAYVWASTETADGSAGSSSTWFHAPIIHASNGNVTTDYARNASSNHGVVPVLEL